MGKRVAPRHRAERARHHRLPLGLPAAAGVLALSVAGFGAAETPTAAPAPAPAAAHVRSSEAGTDAIGFTSTGTSTSTSTDERRTRVSRDSERQALQDTAGDELRKAGGDQAEESNAELKNLGRLAEAKAGEIPKNAWHLPTEGYHLTARFGQAGGRWVSNHTGLDFAAPTGTPIFAVAAGVITETGSAGAYGNRTIETLPDGTEIWYCHQSAFRTKAGQQVTAGQRIGDVGSTGNTTGPHVHLEVRPGGGDPVDPYQALLVHGVKS